MNAAMLQQLAHSLAAVTAIKTLCSEPLQAFELSEQGHCFEKEVDLPGPKGCVASPAISKAGAGDTRLFK